MPVLAIFGAGPALGLSTARLFVTKGYQIALVARDPAKLGQFETDLHSAGAAVASFTADLNDDAEVGRAAREIIGQFGLPDVVLYSPGDVSRLPVPALALTAAELRTWLPLHLLSPVALAQAVLPGMLDRGSGSLLFALGNTARHPAAALASVNTPQAGLLNYLHGVSQTVAPHGVYIGALLIGTLIEGSAAAKLFDAGHFRSVEPGAVPRADPGVLAERLWEMVATREAVEQEVA